MIQNFFRYLSSTVVEEVKTDLEKSKDALIYQFHRFKDGFRIRRIKKELKKKMKRAKDREEWKKYAEEFDRLSENILWKEKVSSWYYDSQYIYNLKESIKNARKENKLPELMSLLRSSSLRNIGNICHPKLYEYCYLGTKTLIEEYREEYIMSLEYITKHEEMSIEEKLNFIEEIMHSHGKSALLLSGGATMGLYHCGVVKTLYFENVLPRIVAGSSVGSVIAALLCTKKFEDVPQLMLKGAINFSAFKKKGSPVFRKILRFLREGNLLDSSVLQEFVRQNIGDITFKEAYNKTGWILNITVTGYHNHDGYRVLNYLSAPDVLIWSAVAASCSIPHVFQPTPLYCLTEKGEIVPYISKDRLFIDGSLGADIPRQRLSETFNVNCFIVSQTNPWYRMFSNGYTFIGFDREISPYEEETLHENLSDGKIIFTFGSTASFLSGVLPKTILMYLNLVHQEYVGDVTFWPNPKIFDYMNLLSMITNPSDDLVERGFIIGEQRAYHKIQHVRALTQIEENIDKNFSFLKKKLASLAPTMYRYLNEEHFSSDEGEEKIQALINLKKM